jgi:hypothetical protein
MMEHMDLKEKRQSDAYTQIDFCYLLMLKLSRDFDENCKKQPYYSWGWIANKSRMIDDIRRLRRELLDLSKMLERR